MYLAVEDRASTSNPTGSTSRGCGRAKKWGFWSGYLKDLSEHMGQQCIQIPEKPRGWKEDKTLAHILLLLTFKQTALNR